MNSHLKGSLQVSSLVGSLFIPGIPQIPLLGHNNQGYPCQDELVANGCFPLFDNLAKRFSGYISRIFRKSPSGQSTQPRTADQPQCNEASRNQGSSRLSRFRNLFRKKKSETLNSHENHVVANSVEQHIPAGNLQTNSVEQTSHSTPFQSQTPGASPALHAIPDLSLDKETPATSIVGPVFRGQRIQITGWRGKGVIEDGPCVLCLEPMATNGGASSTYKDTCNTKKDTSNGNEDIWNLPCKHKFHTKCLQDMIENKAKYVRNDKCPMCRESMLPPGEFKDALSAIEFPEPGIIVIDSNRFPRGDLSHVDLIHDVIAYMGYSPTDRQTQLWRPFNDDEKP